MAAYLRSWNIATKLVNYSITEGDGDTFPLLFIWAIYNPSHGEFMSHWLSGMERRSGSRVFNPRFTKLLSYMIEFPLLVIGVIIGLILSALML